jgi:hypothetical protein
MPPLPQNLALNRETLLNGIGQGGRLAFFEFLALEGFESTHGIPNLQLPEVIHTAIDSLGEEAKARFPYRVDATAFRAILVGLVSRSQGHKGQGRMTTLQQVGLARRPVPSAITG